jgi:hypothetical protein
VNGTGGYGGSGIVVVNYAPMLFYANGLALPFTHVANTPSTEQGLPISGNNLIGEVKVTPSSGYEVCTTANGTYQSGTLSVVPTNGTLNTTVYVRIAAATAQSSPAGVLTVSSPGLPDRQLLLNQGEMLAGLFNSGFFNIPTLTGSQLSGDITVEAWINIQSYANWARVVDIGNSAGTDNILLSQYGTTGRICFTVIGGASGTTSVELITDSAIPLTTWTHVAGVVEANGNMKIYVNGALVKSNTQTATLPRDQTRFSSFIGKSNWGSDALWNGRITDVRLWNVARTQAEIQAGMAIGSISGSAAGLTACYPMGSTGQSPTDDVSGNSYNLTQNSSVQYVKQQSQTASFGDGSQSLTLGETLSGTSSLYLGSGTLSLPECWYEVPSTAVIGGDLTVEGWVKPTRFTTYARMFDFSTDASVGNGATQYLGMSVCDSVTSGPAFWVLGANGTQYTASSTAALPLNAWSHIAGVFGEWGNDASLCERSAGGHGHGRKHAAERDPGAELYWEIQLCE